MSSEGSVFFLFFVSFWKLSSFYFSVDSVLGLNGSAGFLGWMEPGWIVSWVERGSSGGSNL